MKWMIPIVVSLPLLLAPWTARATLTAEGSVTRIEVALEPPAAGWSGDSLTSSSATSHVKDDDQVFITVRELMRLENEQALVAARQRKRQHSSENMRSMDRAAGRAGMETADALRLVGIYGVGKRLFAEVRSGSRAWLYLNGHSLPVGHAAADDLYRLREVAGACVRLEKQGVETRLCLPRTGRP